MKLAWSLLPAGTADQLILDVFCELTPRDERTLRHAAGKVSVSFKTVPVDFRMFDARGIEFEKKHIDIDCEMSSGKKWQFKDFFSFTTFAVADSRKAVVLCERVKTEIVCAMIHAAPLAEFHGAIKTYDVDIETPKEVSNMDHWRRSVLIRGH